MRENLQDLNVSKDILNRIQTYVIKIMKMDFIKIIFFKEKRQVKPSICLEYVKKNHYNLVRRNKNLNLCVYRHFIIIAKYQRQSRHPLFYRYVPKENTVGPGLGMALTLAPGSRQMDLCVFEVTLVIVRFSLRTKQITTTNQETWVKHTKKENAISIKWNSALQRNDQ